MVRLDPTPAQIKKRCQQIRNEWTADEFRRRSHPKSLAVWMPSLRQWAFLTHDEVGVVHNSSDYLN